MLFIFGILSDIPPTAILISTENTFFPAGRAVQLQERPATLWHWPSIWNNHLIYLLWISIKPLDYQRQVKSWVKNSDSCSREPSSDGQFWGSRRVGVGVGQSTGTLAHWCITHERNNTSRSNPWPSECMPRRRALPNNVKDKVEAIIFMSSVYIWIDGCMGGSWFHIMSCYWSFISLIYSVLWCSYYLDQKLYFR